MPNPQLQALSARTIREQERLYRAKLAVRLIHLLVQNGPLQSADRIALPDGGRFRLEPSTNGRFVRVWPD